jgi:hypothetical protein
MIHSNLPLIAHPPLLPLFYAYQIFVQRAHYVTVASSLVYAGQQLVLARYVPILHPA